MKPKISAKGSGKTATKTAKSAAVATETKATQLEQIAEMETREEQRILAATEKMAKEEVSAKQAMADTEKHTEETLRAEAREELSAYKSELTKVMTEQAKKTDVQLKELDAQYAKHAGDEASRVVSDYLHSLLAS